MMMMEINGVSFDEWSVHTSHIRCQEIEHTNEWTGTNAFIKLWKASMRRHWQSSARLATTRWVSNIPLKSADAKVTRLETRSPNSSWNGEASHYFQILFIITYYAHCNPPGKVSKLNSLFRAWATVLDSNMVVTYTIYSKQREGVLFID